MEHSFKAILLRHRGSIFWRKIDWRKRKRKIKQSKWGSGVFISPLLTTVRAAEVWSPHTLRTSGELRWSTFSLLETCTNITFCQQTYSKSTEQECHLCVKTLDLLIEITIKKAFLKLCQKCAFYSCRCFKTWVCLSCLELQRGITCVCLRMDRRAQGKLTPWWALQWVTNGIKIIVKHYFNLNIMYPLYLCRTPLDWH